ncbi:immunoglobulin-like fold-containing [Desulfonema limicola]|uniref:Immunoglobulin-like fold-containing n=1 Tax=Desulfonema limicola TaxID=45656 RepID=A0A975GG67_9BACT|nr:REJ domain-containing protein [Desulfonema limicola]QTA79933.1 immunoglobulin-like fold-containing [Desulfonema limicola]
MFKKLTFTLVVFFISFLNVHAQIPIPARIGGTLTVNGSVITAENMEGYIIKVSRLDGTFFVPQAETDQLNSSGLYIIDIPIFEQGVQDGGANPGDSAVIHVYKDDLELEVMSPPQGIIIVGESNDIKEYDLEVKIDTPAVKADAGPDQTVSSGDLVTLDASGSSAQTYKWEQLEGITIELSDDSSVKPTFTAPVLNSSDPITLIFKLIVTQADTSKSDTVNIIVNPPLQNQKPSADAGDSRTAYSGEIVRLDGSGSWDKEGPVTYQWEQTGGAFAALSDSAVINPEFTAPAYNPDLDMALVFKLIVTDSSGLTDSDLVTITILPSLQNLPPVANAGIDQTVSAGDRVQLDGSNSTDPDNGQGNGIYSYLWQQIGTGTRVTLSNNKSSQPVFTAPDVDSKGESLIFELKVSDKAGLEDTDTVTINVVSENQPPAANAGSDQSVNTGDIVELDGSASSDPDPGDTITYKWEQRNGIPVILSDYTISKPVFTAPYPGNKGGAIGFELIVEDQWGLRHTDRVYINIITDTQPPTADAGPDQTVRTGEKVVLDGSNSTNPENNILLWAQKAGDTPVTLSDAKSVRPEFTAPDVGVDGAVIVFELTVVDNNGLQNTDQVVIKILFTGSYPVADAGNKESVENKTVDEGTVGILDGSDSYSPYGIVDYSWQQISGPVVEISNPNAEKTTFFVPGVDNDNVQLVFELTVRDNNGLSDTDQVTLYIHDFGEGPGADDSSCFINTMLK